MSMKNSDDTIGNRSRDLPVFNAVPQPLRHRVPPLRYSQAEKYFSVRKLPKHKLNLLNAFLTSVLRQHEQSVERPSPYENYLVPTAREAEKPQTRSELCDTDVTLIIKAVLYYPGSYQA
jgi:hypothetical protein